jgi:hypothetical protein
LSEQLNLEAFLSLLPACPGPGALPTAGDDLAFPRYVNSSLAEFIPPHLTRLLAKASLPGSPQVIVVSAPGAVGKSTLAREISFAKKAPLWDLSWHKTVGQGSVLGAIPAAFGYTLLGTVMGHLGGGSLFLVIDALDEALMKAKEGGFRDFLDDVGKYAKSALSVAFVLLGRTRIAEDSWLALTEFGVRTSLYSIDFFDEAQRIRYLERRLQRNAIAAKAIEARRTEFEAARDLVFSQLDKAIDPPSGDKDTREAAAFLGYAPVLESIAVLLDEERDYNALVIKLQGEERRPESKTGSRRIHLLRRVVEHILEREQGQKLLHNLRPLLAAQAPAGWSDWEDLYSPAEQRARLLARILDDPWVPPVNVPVVIRQAYEEQLKNFFDEHPFLREAKSAASIVFEAYLFADALVDPGHALRNQLADYLEGRRTLPSRLLADFYFLFRAASNRPTRLTHVGLLYESLLAGETESRRLRLELDAGDPEPDEWNETSPHVEFGWVNPTADDPDAADLGSISAPLSVEVDDRLTFRKTLKDASVIVPVSARLDGHSSEFVIGPEVQIRAKRLEIANAELLIVKGPPHLPGANRDDSLVVLEALSSDAASVNKVTCYGGLSVSWPGGRAYPWTPYAIDTAKESRDFKNDPRLEPVYRRFRRIVMTFQSRGKGALARIRDKIDNSRTLQGALGKALLNRLLADRLLSIDGRLYFLNRQVANDLVGVSWQDLRRGRTTPKLIDYFKKFADANPDLLSPPE